jgi:hypothetical protein
LTTQSLTNGIKIGTPIEDALLIDNTIKYDDWEEEYVSEKGYWLETEEVISIAIFIKEVEDDVFYSYEWC